MNYPRPPSFTKKIDNRRTPPPPIKKLKPPPIRPSSPVQELIPEKAPIQDLKFSEDPIEQQKLESSDEASIALPVQQYSRETQLSSKTCSKQNKKKQSSVNLYDSKAQEEIKYEKHMLNLNQGPEFVSNRTIHTMNKTLTPRKIASIAILNDQQKTDCEQQLLLAHNFQRHISKIQKQLQSDTSNHVQKQLAISQEVHHKCQLINLDHDTIFPNQQQSTQKKSNIAQLSQSSQMIQLKKKTQQFSNQESNESNISQKLNKPVQSEIVQEQSTLSKELKQSLIKSSLTPKYIELEHRLKAFQKKEEQLLESSDSDDQRGNEQKNGEPSQSNLISPSLTLQKQQNIELNHQQCDERKISEKLQVLESFSKSEQLLIPIEKQKANILLSTLSLRQMKLENQVDESHEAVEDQINNTLATQPYYGQSIEPEQIQSPCLSPIVFSRQRKTEDNEMKKMRNEKLINLISSQMQSQSDNLDSIIEEGSGKKEKWTKNLKILQEMSLRHQTEEANKIDYLSKLFLKLEKCNKELALILSNQ